MPKIFISTLSNILPPAWSIFQLSTFHFLIYLAGILHDDFDALDMGFAIGGGAGALSAVTLLVIFIYKQKQGSLLAGRNTATDQELH